MMSSTPLPHDVLSKVDYHSKRVGLALRLALEEFVCKSKAKTGCVNLFFTRPRLLKDLLLEYYEGSEESVKFLVKEMIIKPVFIIIEENPYGREDELADLFVKDPEKARDNVVNILLRGKKD